MRIDIDVESCNLVWYEVPVLIFFHLSITVKIFFAWFVVYV